MAGISKAEREALNEVKNKFDAVELTDEQGAVVDGIRKGFAKLAVDLHRTVPDGRNKSLAMTYLEDACMRAIRGVSHDGGQAAGIPAQAEAPAVEDTTPAVEKEKAPRKPRSRRAREVVTA